MKFIPNTNEMYKFDAQGNVFSVKSNKYLKCTKGKYSIIFTHGRRGMRKQALCSLFYALEMDLKEIEFAKKYKIRQDGFVWSTTTNCEIKPFYDKDGYRRIAIVCNDGIRRKYRVARLVALTYIPNPQNLPLINHIDEIKTNDYVDNLEWCTYSYNTKYSKSWENRKRDELGKFI